MNQPTALWHELPEPVRRMIRTWVQAFVGAILLQTSVDVVPTASALGDVLVSGAWAAVVATLSLAHNLLDASRVGPDTR